MTSLIYRLKSGARLPVSAQVAGEECERLERQGMLTPANLVEASRPEDAPLHDAFEWDDDTAAEKWRETQAAYIIRSVVVNVVKDEEPTRAFVVTVSDDKRRYESIGYVLRNADSREALLGSALKELAAFKRKYEALSELSRVIGEIDEVIGSQAKLELTA